MHSLRFSRRQILAAGAAVAAAQLTGRASLAKSLPTPSAAGAGCPSGRRVTGLLSGNSICLPDVDASPMPEISSPGVIFNGRPVPGFEIPANPGLPDVRSHRRKLGLIIPATNTSMEHELWSLISRNEGVKGVGIHTANVITPKPQLKTEADLREYKNQFVSGLSAAVAQSLLAQPEHLIMGMSLEHILTGLSAVEKVMADARARAKLPWSTWHEAAPAALKKLNAKRIGLLTPFNKTGNENAVQMFTDLGFEVVSSFGFACANALHIAHVPDWAKEKAITEYLATRENRLDAVVQCGTNMSLIQVAEKLEPKIKVPILGINAVLLWHALRETGIKDKVEGGGQLLRLV